MSGGVENDSIWGSLSEANRIDVVDETVGRVVCCPQFAGLVTVLHDGELAVGAEPDTFDVAREGDHLATIGMPEFGGRDAGVLDDEELAVGAERSRADGICEGNHLAAVGVPQFAGFVGVPHNDGFAVGAERDTVDAARKRDHPAAVGVPQFAGFVFVGVPYDEELAVGAERDVDDFTCELCGACFVGDGDCVIDVCRLAGATPAW